MDRKALLKGLIDSQFAGSQAEFARAIKRSPAQVHQWLSGHRSVGDAGARHIELTLGLPTGWMNQESGAEGDALALPSLPYTARADSIKIQQFETGGAMGSGLLLRDQPGTIQSWNVTPEWVNKNIKHHSGVVNLCIVTGFGDSMRGMFNSGDPLIVDRGVNTVEFDAVYFFRVADEGFIKRLQRIPGEGIRVISTNKEYESWTIRPEMDFEVFGRVLKVWRSEDF